MAETRQGLRKRGLEWTEWAVGVSGASLEVLAGAAGGQRWRHWLAQPFPRSSWGQVCGPACQRMYGGAASLPSVPKSSSWLSPPLFRALTGHSWAWGLQGS